MTLFGRASSILKVQFATSLLKNEMLRDEGI